MTAKSPRKSPQPAPLWNEVIQQDVHHGGWTPAARRRTLLTALHVAGWSCVIALCSWGVLVGVREITQTGNPVERSGSQPLPLRTVDMRSDGFLDEQWVRGHLGLRDGTDMMALDLDALRAKLESAGQVRTATLRRRFPDTLEVHLMERTPVARVRVAHPELGQEDLLVDREGTVYRGHNYEPATVQALPHLAGMKLRSVPGGFAPIEGMTTVARVLDQAAEKAPHLVRRWRVISLATLPRLTIRTDDVREIVLDSGDFARQIARLDYILDYHRSRSGSTAGLEHIDLTLGPQVPVGIAAESPLREFAQLEVPERTDLRSRN